MHSPLIDKAAILDRIEVVFAGLELFDPMAETLAELGMAELKGRQTGARQVLAALRQGIYQGEYDVPVLDVGVAVRYIEEDLDTEDMDDLAPEEESVMGQQDEFIGGIVILDPATTPEERAELEAFYASIGYMVQ